MTNMAPIAREIENSRTGGDSHLHDLSHVFSELHDLQVKDGGPQSALFKQDLADLNKQLMKDGVLPSLQIMGMDNANHFLTKNAQTGESNLQNANAVDDYGARQKAATEAKIEYTDAFKLPMDPGTDSLVKVTTPPETAKGQDSETFSRIFKGMNPVSDQTSSVKAENSLAMNQMLKDVWSSWDGKQEVA